jgi:hypothetical protein
MNPKRNFGHLGRKQRAVINDLLNGLNRYETLEKNKVRPARYREWLKNKLFAEELRARFDAAKCQGKFVMAHCFPQAAQKLAGLIDSEKEETARKACIDVISLQKSDIDRQTAEKDQCENPSLKISDEKAARMLAILAEDETKSVGATLAVAQSPKGA